MLKTDKTRLRNSKVYSKYKPRKLKFYGFQVVLEILKITIFSGVLRAQGSFKSFLNSRVAQSTKIPPSNAIYHTLESVHIAYAPCCLLFLGAKMKTSMQPTRQWQIKYDL